MADNETQRPVNLTPAQQAEAEENARMGNVVAMVDALIMETANQLKHGGMTTPGMLRQLKAIREKLEPESSV
jgi:hypothetical protein